MNTHKSIVNTLSKRGYLTLLALLIAITSFAQEITVNGTVLDETDTPLIGATIQIKNTQKGVITDFDGKFSIKANNNATLVVSYIGYQNQEIKLKGQKNLNLKLIPDNAMLDEVVVVGYGSMKKSDLTGSVSSVAAKSIEGFKTGSVVEALGGQIAGVQITQSDGTPGSGFDIKIRGVGTVNGDSSPLYIVDGFEVSDIDYLPNSDIESVEVLKDASASAIYGARAANGVVLVTTKSGKEGKPVITYNGSATYRNIPKKLDMLSTYEFAALQVELNPTKYGTTYFQEGNDADGVPYRHQTLEDYLTIRELTGRVNRSSRLGLRTTISVSVAVQKKLSMLPPSHISMKMVSSQTAVIKRMQVNCVSTKRLINSLPSMPLSITQIL